MEHESTAIEDQRFWTIVRIFTTTFILVVIDLILRNVNPYIITMINIIVVWLFDTMDSIPMRVQYGSNWGLNIEYQIYDKYADLILYFVILMLHLIHVRRIGTFEIVFISLYIFRMIGIVLFLTYRDSIYLVLFPNFFCDNIALYIFLKYVMQVSGTRLAILIAISVPLKVMYEVLHHKWWNKQG